MNKQHLLILFFTAVTTTAVYAQDVPTDSTTITISSSDSTRNGFRWPWQKNKDKEHTNGRMKEEIQVYKDSLESLKDTIALYTKKNKELEQQIQQLKNKSKPRNDDMEELLRSKDIALSDSIIATFSKNFHDYYDANAFFCRAVMESPLFYRYDSLHVRQSVETAKAMGYNLKNHPYHKYYLVYNELLLNYYKYYQELVDNVGEVLNQFSALGNSIDRNFEKARFEDRLKNSTYYKIRGKEPYGSYRHIFYLDFMIERTRKLFDSNKDFTKNNFEDILNALLNNK